MFFFSLSQHNLHIFSFSFFPLLFLQRAEKRAPRNIGRNALAKNQIKGEDLRKKKPNRRRTFEVSGLGT